MSRVCLLFAGQGAQAVGMGRDLHAASAAVRGVYADGSKRSGIDLARVSFEGPESELVRTDVCQPAIVAASLAAWIALQDRHPGLRVEAAAGLSLGEYAALACAGALSAADAIGLVAERGRLMQRCCEAREGAMASVLGASADLVEAAVAEASSEAEPCVVANYNSPKQQVISGSVAGVAAAMERLEARGARRIIPLKVAGAYHSPLMADAARGLRAHLDRAPLAPPRLPVYANVTARPHPREPEAIRDLLERQVTAPVRFAETIEALLAEGFTTFYELGPGTVLAGLVRQAAKAAGREVRCASLLAEHSFAEVDGRLGVGG